MKKIMTLLVLLSLCGISLIAQSNIDAESNKIEIIKVIQNAYADGIANYGDIKAINNGFHPGFAILGLWNNSLTKYPIYRWIENVKFRKKEGKYPLKEKIIFKYPLINITGNAAIVKIEYYEGEKRKYTDYLSLYKFKEGWRIVSKIFYEHKKTEL